MSLNKIDLDQFTGSRKKEISVFFVIFYLVGIIGLSLSFSFPLFLELIPFALLLSFLGLILFHPSKKDKKSILVFIGIFITGFIIEAIGVNSGLIFGHYEYGKSLGFKLFSTPVIIGLNWLFLVYTTSSVLEKFKIHNLLKVILASLLMVVYDIVLEQVAPKIDMWYWKNDLIPIQNYLAWFGIAVFFHSVIKVSKIKTENALAHILLICQFLFFLSLLILLG
ncbi:MAG: carotenoid biosynthesis protein [Bacteroidales bacterium]